ncbi:MAG TPA: hypothetical protein VIB39_01600 [Candidatus Angelobacter sp.]|jgi:hypothetical protein
MESDILGTDLHPGDLCAQNGVYEVVHFAHRAPHKVVVSANNVFPACRQCGLNVRFRLLMHSTEVLPRWHARAARKNAN